MAPPALALLEREIAHKYPDQGALVKLPAAEEAETDSLSLVVDAGDVKFLCGGSPPGRFLRDLFREMRSEDEEVSITADAFWHKWFFFSWCPRKDLNLHGLSATGT